MGFGHRAVSALGETLGAYTESVVGASPEVLQRDSVRQFHHLRLAEVLAQRVEEFLRDKSGAHRHLRRVLYDELLQGREGIALLVLRKPAKLLLGDPPLPPQRATDAGRGGSPGR